jgi:hypothetical protein
MPNHLRPAVTLADLVDLLPSMLALDELHEQQGRRFSRSEKRGPAKDMLQDFPFRNRVEFLWG